MTTHMRTFSKQIKFFHNATTLPTDSFMYPVTHETLGESVSQESVNELLSGLAQKFTRMKNSKNKQEAIICEKLSISFSKAGEQQYNPVNQLTSAKEHVYATLQALANLLLINKYKNFFFHWLLQSENSEERFWAPLFFISGPKVLSIYHYDDVFVPYQPPISIIQREEFRYQSTIDIRKQQTLHSKIAKQFNKLLTISQKSSQADPNSPTGVFCSKYSFYLQQKLKNPKKPMEKHPAYKAYTPGVACWASYVSRNLMRFMDEKSGVEPSYVTEACRAAVNGLKHRGRKNKSHEASYRFLVLHLQFCLNLARNIALDTAHDWGSDPPFREEFTELVGKLWAPLICSECTWSNPDLEFILPSDSTPFNKYIVYLARTAYQTDKPIDSTIYNFKISRVYSAKKTELF